MKITLTPIEIRVLGSLLEKEATTPENYPLSLNALTNACNQKTNRDPVMSLTEATVLEAVESLTRKTLVTQRGGASSRVPKYAHRLNNRLQDEYDFSAAEQAALCVLMLRGPQTGGEIRTRSSRLYEFADIVELDQTLLRLAERDDGPFVVKLERQAGHKEHRYAQLWGGDVDLTQIAPTVDANTDAPLSDDSARITELEFKVQALSHRVDELEQKLGAFMAQFE